MKCTNCGAQLPEDSTFCVECGGRVEAQAGSNGSFFSSAGDLGDDLGSKPAPVVSVWDTVHHEEPAAVQPPVAPPAAPPVTPPVAAPVTPPVTPPPRQCPRCGAALGAEDIFCVNCGLNLNRKEAPAAERVAPPPAAEPVEPRPVAPAPVVRNKATKSGKGMLIGIAAGALALILLVIILGAATGWFGLVGPGTQVMSAVNKTVKNGNFTVTFEMSDDYDDVEGVAMVDIDVKKREVQMYIEMDSDGDEVVAAIYDGYLMVYYEDYDYGYAEKISSELDDIFDAYEAALAGDREEISDMLEDMGLDEDDVEDYMDLEELEKCVKKLVNKLNSKSWLKENAGYSSRKDGGATIHSLEPDIEDLVVAILEIMEPAFQDEDDYEDVVDAAGDIDDVDILVEIGIKSGYLVSADMEFGEGSYEMEMHASFTDIGKTKIDEAVLEDLLDDCK